MATLLYINGVLVDRSAARVILHEMNLSIDSPDSLEFSQLVEPAGTGDFGEGDTVVVVVDSIPRFNGFLAKAVPINIGSGPIAVGYLAYGVQFLANNLFVTSSDGTGFMQFNLPPTDPGYLSSNAGLSVGTILGQVLDQHAAALALIGITSYDPDDLLALTVVPPEPITIAGRLWDSMCDLIEQYHPNFAMWADGSGAIQIKDTAALPDLTLTLDDDPIILDSITKDHSEAFTRVVVRGRADIEGAYLSLNEGTLAAGWTHDEQLHWTIQDFFQPRGAFDAGNILTQTSDTLTIKSDDATTHWTTNHWNDIGAIIWSFNPIATGLTFSEQRGITASTAMVAGGTSTITVNLPFNNTGYSRYQIRGTRTATSLVWRKLTIVPEYIGLHLSRQFNHSLPWSPVDGEVVQTLTPQAVVCWSSSGDPPFNEFPCPIELVLPDGATPGYIICLQPLCMAYSTQAALQTGGAAVQAPGDFKCLVPYSRGPLQAVAPASGFEGTAYSVDNIERTLYRDVDSWLDKNAVSLMTEFAQKILDSRKDTVYEGCLTYLGKYTPALTLGSSLNIARADGITGWEAIDAAIRSVSLQWPQSGANIWQTRLNFTSRRRAFTGDRLYVHPGYGTQDSALQSWNPFGLSTAGMIAITQARQQQFEQDYLTPPSGQDDLGITFDEPGKNTYKRLLPLQSEILKSEQHQRRMAMEREKQASVDAQAAAHQDAREREGAPVDAEDRKAQRTAHIREFEKEAKLFNSDQRAERAKARKSSPYDEMPADVFGGDQ